MKRGDATQHQHGEEPRQLSVELNNTSISWTPYPVTVMRPFAPFYTVKRSEPFQPKSMWKGAVHGIKALQRLKLNVGDSARLRSELLVVTGHTMGHLMLVNADNYAIMNKANHYNNVTIANLVVTNTMIYTLVERDAKNGPSGDDSEVYVWDMTTFELLGQLSAHDERVCSIVVDPEDEYRVVTGGVDKAIYLWDTRAMEKPVGRLTGHQMAVTALLIYRNTLVSGSADSTVKVWDLNTMTCTNSYEGHLGTITFLQWVEEPHPPRHHKTGEHSEAEQGQIISACAGGILRSYRIDHNGRTALNWTNKAHKTYITDVCWDEVVVISASASDGLNFFHTGTKQNIKYPFTDGGVRQLAVDINRKCVVAGADNGQLIFFNYAGIANPSAIDAEGLRVFATLQPHVGSVTSMVLERSGNGQWERLITASNDQSIFVLDFDVDRDSKSFPGYGSNNLVQITQTGTIVTCQDINPVLWDATEMVRKTDAATAKALSGHTRRITSVSYSAEHRTIITGADDGHVRTWDVSLYPEDQPERKGDEVVAAADAIDVGMAVKALSEPAGQWVVVGSQKSATGGQVTKAGAITIVDFARGSILGQATATFVFPIAAQLHAYIHPETKEKNFVALVQLRNGEVMMLGGSSEGYTVLRTIVREQVSYSLEREGESFGLGMPVPLRSRQFISHAVSRVEYLTADDRTLRCVEVTTLPADNSSQTLFSVTFDSKINDVEYVRQGAIHCVVALENGSAVMLGSKGEELFEVRYDGSVADVKGDAIRPPRRVSSLVQLKGADEGNEPPGCSTIAVSENARVIVFGYRDGVLQLWDLSQRKVCRRIHAHQTAVGRAWILPNQLRLASTGVDGTLRYDTMYLRHVRDTSDKQPSPVPEE